MTDKEKISIYNNFLISLHTSIWTGNNDKVREYLKRVERYSYARTNSSEGTTADEEEELLERTLINLTK